jgi:hypothetical protein
MPRKYIVVLILFCIMLNESGFLWKLFEPVLFYDEIAHFITPFTLVLILAEIVYRSGGDDEFFNTPLRAIITGSVIGLLGATGWEGVEVLMSRMGISVSNTLPDTIFDIFLGVLGGAAGAWAADRYLDRIFGRSRTNAHQPRGPLALLRLVPLVLDVVLHAACALFFLEGRFRGVLAGLAMFRGLVELVAYVVLPSA